MARHVVGGRREAAVAATVRPAMHHQDVAIMLWRLAVNAAKPSRAAATGDRANRMLDIEAASAAAPAVIAIHDRRNRPKLRRPAR